MKGSSSIRQLDTLLKRTFSCPTCSNLRLRDPLSKSRKRQRLDRSASTLSTTAINGTRPVPSRNRVLYEALSEIKTKASAHVNLSRLQLAIQGLESDNPVTRIALLGLNVQDVARRVARLLLADALENEQDWENQILQHEGAHGILIRYGQPQNASIPQRTTIPILQIPAPTLQNLNIELLVTSINSEVGNSVNIPPEAFLAPAVGVPTAFDGRQVTVNQPVHQALLIAQGFDELVNAIQLLNATHFQSEEDKSAVILAANLSNSNSSSPKLVLISDVARAEKGINAIRQSVKQATTYEHEWLASGIPQISAALTSPSFSNPLSPPVENLISAILTSATTSLQHRAANIRTTTQLTSVDIATQSRTVEAVEDFSRAAHLELQSGLASAWSSRNWRKLSWYKLFWRVDDVGLIVSDLVTNTWLPKTERATYEMSGRLTQIGINPVMNIEEVPQTEHRTAFEPEPARSTLLDPAPPLLATSTVAPSNEIIMSQPSEPVLKLDTSSAQPSIEMQPLPLPVPITSAISSRRASYLNQQITSLTTTAQQLVFRTLSISGLSAGLSALTYVSTIAPTVYEAGTIFAVGTVFALYRMQSGWQQATKALERGLFEEGREVIRRVVERMKELVMAKVEQKATGDPVEIQIYQEASQAIEKAKAALEELKDTPSSTDASL